MITDVRAQSDKPHWMPFIETEGQAPLCFVTGWPVAASPARDNVRIFITHRPLDRRIGEVSVEPGYVFKNGAPASITIDGGKSFRLLTQGGSAWTYKEADNPALVAAMLTGATMVITGTSAQGRKMTDTYSLKGFPEAYDVINAACTVK